MKNETLSLKESINKKKMGHKFYVHETEIERKGNKKGGINSPHFLFETQR
jgi:hypothetical protein